MAGLTASNASIGVGLGNESFPSGTAPTATDAYSASGWTTTSSVDANDYFEFCITANAGYVMDLKILSDLIQTEIIERFDHRNLNEDCEAFRNLNPTAENICLVIYNLLRAKINPALDLQIRLYETERNFVEYPAA